MSRLELPADMYDQEYTIAVADQITRFGLDLQAARTMAAYIMEHCFICRETAIGCDVQKDYDDERDGDWTR